MKTPLTQFGILLTLALGVLNTQLALANTEKWIGVSGVSATTNWSDNLNWSNLTGGGSPGPNGNDVLFGDLGAVGAAGTINSVVDTLGLNPLSLTFTNDSASPVLQFHSILIPAGIGMTNANGLTVGGKVVDGYVTTVSMIGGGTFVQNGTTITIKNTGSSSQTESATLDLSGVSNFVCNASAGTMVVAGSGSDARGGGVFNLAGLSNNVTVGTLNFNTGSGNSSSFQSLIQLGAGTNILNVGTFSLVGTKASNGKVQFIAGAPSTAGLRLRGVNGNTDDTSRATLTLGDRNNTGSGNTEGDLLLNGYPVDIKVGTLTIGQDRSGSTSATHGGIGVVQFDTGTLDASGIVIAACTTGDPGAPAATGTLTVGANGTLLVGGSGISMANQAHGTATGNLNINGGAVRVLGNIFKATTAGTASISMTGGNLNLAAVTNAVGTIANPIDNLSLNNSTLTFNVAVSAPGAAVKNLTINGTSDLINISSVPAVSSFSPPPQFPVITYTSISGTYDFTLGTLPGTYQGYLSNNVANSSVDIVLTNSLLKNDVWRGNVSANWDTTTPNWFYSGSSVNYLQGDFVTFDETLTGSPNVILTTNLSPAAVTFNNSSHNYVLSGAFKLTGTTLLTKEGSDSATLMENGGDDFIGGIIVSGGTLILDNTNSAISGGTSITGGTLQIGNNDAGGALPSGAVSDDAALVFNRVDSVTIATAISGSGTITQNGSGTLTLMGANAYGGNTLINSGTLALSGSGSIAASASVSVNSSTLDVSAANQPVTLTSLTLNNGNLTVAPNANGSAEITATSLTFAGAGNHLNVSTLPPISSYPVTFTIIQAAGPASGSFNLAVGTLPAGTPAYGATVSQSLDLSTVFLTVTNGPIGVRPAVGWTGADVPNLNTNWSDRLNWQLPGAPTFGENVFFTPTDAQTASALSPSGGGAAALQLGNINNIVDANTTISSLTYQNTNSSYHNTFINNGLTLSVTNSGSVVVGSTTFDVGAAPTESVAIAGPGAVLNVNNTNGTFYVGLGSASSGSHQATLDLSALGTFNATLSRFLVGAGSGADGIALARESGIVYLAQTNTITAAITVSGTESSDTSASAVAFGVGDNDGNAGAQCFLYLGQTNAIFADALCVSRQKQNAQMLFNTTFTLPSAYFRGRDGASPVSIWSLADGVVNSGTATCTGVEDFSGGRVNALVGTMYVGRAGNNGSGGGIATGTLSFDAGIINAGTAFVGLEPANNATKHGVGAVNVASNSTAGLGATLSVSGGLNLGFNAGGSGSTSTSGTLSMTNGTVFANAIVPGTNSPSTINMAGGRLVLTNASGNATGPLTNLTLAPLGSLDNLRNDLYLPIGTNSSGMTVATLNLDGLDTTTNVLNIESVGPVSTGSPELPLIKYSTMNLVSGTTFNVGLGTLPTGYAGFLTNDTANSQIALVLTAALHPRPVMTSISTPTATTLAISGINGFANRPYSVLISTNAALPLAVWTSAATKVFAADGSFSFTTTINPTTPQQFFILQTQ